MRELITQAHEKALDAALRPLADDFDRWRAGEVDAFELSERIHAFHDGPARDLWNQYTSSMKELVAAHAIHTGLIDRASVPAELLAHLATALAFHEEMGAADTVPDVRVGGSSER
ncbi:MAG: hypothetical protein JWM27_4628 [Gemmatimonadetes bacterium]|nr:hypothetical protein [Gemmatimonadota bacterium]